MKKNIYQVAIIGVLIFSATVITHLQSFAQTTIKTDNKMKILIHVTIGPENPTKAALAFLVARTAIEVTLFLAGDAVQLIRDNVLDNLSGLGTGKLREHFDAIVKAGGKFYISGNSSKARGVRDAGIKGKPIEFALPNVLVKLLIENDKALTY